MRCGQHTRMLFMQHGPAEHVIDGGGDDDDDDDDDDYGDDDYG